MRHFPYLSSSLSSTYLLLNLLLLSSTVKILDDIIFHLLHFVAFFHVASRFSTGVDNKKVGVDNKKALELTNGMIS